MGKILEGTTDKVEHTRDRLPLPTNTTLSDFINFKHIWFYILIFVRLTEAWAMDRFAAQHSKQALSTNVCLTAFPGPEIVQTQGNKGLGRVPTLLTLPTVLLAVSLQD